MDKDTPMIQRPVQVKKHSDGFSVMFWGCFSKHAFGPNVNVDGSMNSQQYIEFIRDYLLPEREAAKQAFDGDWRIMQDNAPCHRASIVKDFLRENGVEFIDWPPYSPDLNPIENVWSWIKRKLLVEYGTPETEEELI
jgi:transposase